MNKTLTTSPAAYIFLCRDHTLQECLDENLFGGQESYYKQTGEIPKGIPLFLYNFSAHLLEGAFISTSAGGWDIIPEAWEGKYRWQVRSERTITFPPLMKSEIIPILGNYQKFPKATLSENQLEQLLALFQQKEQLSDQEKGLRQQTPHNLYCLDGHRVRSEAEQVIDNWLYSARLSHAYEAALPFDEAERNCDFLVHRPGKSDVYIEFWGLTTKEYDENKQKKVELYRKYNLQLIEIFPKDLNRIDDVLSVKLK